MTKGHTIFLFTILNSEWPKIHRVLVVLSAIGLIDHHELPHLDLKVTSFPSKLALEHQGPVVQSILA